MKKLLFIAFIFFGSLQLFAQDEIQWMSMNNALEAQKKNSKENIYGCLYRLVWPL